MVIVVFMVIGYRVGGGVGYRGRGGGHGSRGGDVDSGGGNGAVGTDRSVYDLISNGSQSHMNNIGQVAVIILLQFRR